MNYAERLLTAAGVSVASLLVGLGASSMQEGVGHEHAEQVRSCQEQSLGALLLRDCIDEANAQSKLAHDGFEALETAAYISVFGSASIGLIAFRRRQQQTDSGLQRAATAPRP